MPINADCCLLVLLASKQRHDSYRSSSCGRCRCRCRSSPTTAFTCCSPQSSATTPNAHRPVVNAHRRRVLPARALRLQAAPRLLSLIILLPIPIVVETFRCLAVDADANQCRLLPTGAVRLPAAPRLRSLLIVLLPMLIWVVADHYLLACKQHRDSDRYSSSCCQC
jgi:hypothetical protein